MATCILTSLEDERWNLAEGRMEGFLSQAFFVLKRLYLTDLSFPCYRETQVIRQPSCRWSGISGTPAFVFPNSWIWKWRPSGPLWPFWALVLQALYGGLWCNLAKVVLPRRFSEFWCGLLNVQTSWLGEAPSPPWNPLCLVLGSFTFLIRKDRSETKTELLWRSVDRLLLTKGE